MKKWLYMGTGGIGALVLVAAALFVYTRAADAAPGGVAQTIAGDIDAALPSAARQLAPDGHDGGIRVDDEALAAALGITVEELDAAYIEANTAAVEQAV